MTDQNVPHTFRDGNIEITKGYKHLIKRWTVGVPVEHYAEAQLAYVADLPFIYKHVAVMPDVHAGIGATVGTVIATQDAVVPSAVGVDIGCGMMAVQTTLRAPMLKDLAKIRALIEKAVPHGFAKGRDPGSWENPPVAVEVAWEELKPGYTKIKESNPACEHKGPEKQLGTLGTGNHFIEVCLDKNDQVWFVLHSGSRGVGNRIGTYFIRLAKDDMKKYYVNLPNMDLSFLPEGTPHFDQYMKAVQWAQRYAQVNRELMMEAIVKTLRKSKLVPKFDADVTEVNCHHNYVTRENHFKHNIWVTRKGAISARKGQLGIIPGSMGARSYIVSGLGNPESFTSASHGAGRLMSRTQARQQFTLKDHRQATEGIECRKDKDVLDETPGAYKDIDAVMEAQKDLVEIKHELRQIICVKG